MCTSPSDTENRSGNPIVDQGWLAPRACEHALHLQCPTQVRSERAQQGVKTPGEQRVFVDAEIQTP